MNPMSFLQLKPAWEQFKANHPKLLSFVSAASKNSFLDEGRRIENTVTNGAGKSMSANVRIK